MRARALTFLVGTHNGHLPALTDMIIFYFLLSVSKVIRGQKTILDKLAANLDRTSHRVIKTWEHLACTEEINAPLEIRLKCKLNSENSCTVMLFETLSSDVEYEDTIVKDLMDALKEIGRNDVKKIITESEACRGRFKLHPLWLLIACTLD